MGFRFSNLNALRRSRRAGAAAAAFRPQAGHHAAASPLWLAENHQNHSRTSRRWHVGHSHGHHHAGKKGEEADGVFRLGLAADIALSAGKAFTGYLSGSTAIIADAAHSVSDVVLSGVAWLSFRAAKAPKDKEHPYGHGKFETLGALGISGMLLVTSGGIAWHAVDVLQGILMSAPDTINYTLEHGNNGNHVHVGHHHGIDLDHPILALSMIIISISVKEGLYWITKRAGEREGSGLMKANAWHHRADAVSSIVALIGVGGNILGMPILDPLAGIIVSGMIFKAGIETGYQSVMELVDTGVPLDELAPIRKMITQVEGVKGCHRLRGRKAGSSLYLDVHIEVDPFLSVSAAHDIEKMTLEHITRHSLQGKVLLQVQVSMPTEMSIRDAMNVGKEAEEAILRAASSIDQVSIQLRLGQPIPQLDLRTGKTEGKQDFQN